MANADKFGETLRALRTERGLSQQQLAERMAVTLLAGGHMPKELFRPEDIRDEGLRAIAEKLLAGVTRR